MVLGDRYLPTIADEMTEAMPTPLKSGDKLAHRCAGPMALNWPSESSMRKSGKPMTRQQMM